MKKGRMMVVVTMTLNTNGGSGCRLEVRVAGPVAKNTDTKRDWPMCANRNSNSKSWTI